MRIEKRCVKGRYQGRPLPSGCHVPTAEISDHCDAGLFADLIGITDLQGKRNGRIRSMANGLPVAADRGYL